MPLVGLEIDDEKGLEKYLDLLERSGHVLSPGLPLDNDWGSFEHSCNSLSIHLS